MNTQPIRGRAGSYGGQVVQVEVDVPDTELHFERDERIAIIREDVLDALLEIALDKAVREYHKENGR